MLLKSKNNNLPSEFTQTKQVNFDDLEFEAEYVTDEEIEEETKKTVYYTISGKEQQYHPDWKVYKQKDLDIGDEAEGMPEITIFEKKEKNYDSIRLRIVDDVDESFVELWFNFPKKQYPYVHNINKYFDFYRTCFDFIYSVLKWRGEENVVDKNGEEINKFSRVNLENFAKYVDQQNRVTVKITEGNPESEYNSWIITKME